MLTTMVRKVWSRLTFSWDFMSFLAALNFSNLLQGFDPIFDTSTELPANYPDSSRFHLKYFIPFSMSTVVVLDCLQLIARNGFKLDSITDMYQRILFIAWPKYWEQGDVIFLTSYIFLPLLYLHLTVNKFEHRKNFLFLVERGFPLLKDYNGKALSPTLSANLLLTHSRFKSAMNKLKIVMLCDAHLIFTTNFYLSYLLLVSPDITIRILIFLIITPFFVSYVVHGVHMSNYFIMNCKLISVKQNYYIGQIERLATRASNLPESRRAYARLWMAYQKVIRLTLDLVDEIRYYNDFFSFIMTLTLSLFLYAICYGVYLFVIAKTSTDRLVMILPAGLALIFFLLIFLHTGVSSDVIEKNVQIHRSIRCFQFRYRTDRLGQIIRKNLIDDYWPYYHNAAFKFINTYVINHKLFEILFSYLLILSLKLFGAQLSRQINMNR